MCQAVVVLLALAAAGGEDPRDDAVHRGIAFLSREVPRWRRENQCYSCHNNGDGSRALYSVREAGWKVDPLALQETHQWLNRPGLWSDNGGDGEFSDKRLASLQFACAQIAAFKARETIDRGSLAGAARQVAEAQSEDGSWTIGAPGSVGSPVTYGRFLATTLARQVLIANADGAHAPRIARADRFLRTSEPKTVLASAGVLWGLDGAQDEQAVRQRRVCLTLISAAENRGGGWGPYRISRAEPFDTAVVLMAIQRETARTDGLREMMKRGRGFLIDTQESDGGWPATTRPARGDSYAQRISTSAWAVMALIEWPRRRGG